MFTAEQIADHPFPDILIPRWCDLCDFSARPSLVRTTGGAMQMTEKTGHGSATAQKANAKAAKEGEKNPRKSSAAQGELGNKRASAKQK